MDLQNMIALIESPKTDETKRDDLISKLNIYGYSEDAIKEEALAYWSVYFEDHMADILQEQQSITSHVLDSEDLKVCFDERFEEYKNRKKDLGIDDIRKYWYPL